MLILFCELLGKNIAINPNRTKTTQQSCGLLVSFSQSSQQVVRDLSVLSFFLWIWGAPEGSAGLLWLCTDCVSQTCARARDWNTVELIYRPSVMFHIPPLSSHHKRQRRWHSVGFMCALTPPGWFGIIWAPLWKPVAEIINIPPISRYLKRCPLMPKWSIPCIPCSLVPT